MAASASHPWLGIDLGTSSVKVVLVDAESGETLASAQRALGLDTPEPLSAEQDPDAWWAATTQAVRAVLGEAGAPRVSAVGLTGQKHALVVLDEEDRPLAPAILWCDGRATEDAAALACRIPDLARQTGAPALPGYLVPKWHRFRRVRPAVAGRARRLCFAKDWIRLQLTGRFATDRTEASSAQLQDARRPDRWDEDRCRRMGVDPRLLPPIHRCHRTTGRVSAAGAAATGLEVGTPVVAGAGDNEAAALACGAARPGRVAVILGTSGTIVGAARRRGPVGGLVWGRHVTGRGLAATGTVLSAGRALAWIRDATHPAGTSVETVLEEAFAVSPVDRLPLFLPSLAGERSPVPDPEARAAFAELEIGHGRAHLARAVIEGVALAVGQVVDLLRRSRVEVSELRLTSGGAASAAWCGLIAAAANVPIRVVGGADEPARGAALLAGARDASDDVLLALASRAARPGSRLAPDPDDVARLAVAKERLRLLRAALVRVRGAEARGPSATRA